MNKETLEYYKKLDEELEKGNKNMIPLSFDYLVKSFFSSNQIFLRKFLDAQIGSSIGIDFLDENNIIKIGPNELNKDSKDEHFNKIDIFIYVNNDIYIDLEINTKRYKYVFNRNLTYFLKLKVSSFKTSEESKDLKDKSIYQLNINTNKDDKNKDRIGSLKNGFKDFPIDELGEHTIFTKDVEYYSDLYYNLGEEISDSKKWLLLFGIRKYSELYKLLCDILEEKEASLFMKEMERLNSDELVISAAEKEYFERQIRNAELKDAKKEKSIEITKNLLKINMKLEDISKATGLSIKEIEKLA